MAMLLFCENCNEYTVHGRNGCCVCIGKKDVEMREAYIVERSKLSIEERLSLIENEIYELIHYPKISIHEPLI